MANKKLFHGLDLLNNKITNVAAPVDNTDVATKASAQAQANTAKSEAISAAATDATIKADAAQAAAIAAAALDATTKANAAQSAAEATAALDATSKANAAVTSANTYTDTAISNLVDGAPTALNTLNELAVALQNEESATAALVLQIDGVADDVGALQTDVSGLQTDVGTINTSLSSKLNIATGIATGSPAPTSEGYEYTITHGLNKANVIVQAYDGNDAVDVFIRKVDNNNVKIITGSALNLTSLTVVVAG